MHIRRWIWPSWLLTALLIAAGALIGLLDETLLGSHNTLERVLGLLLIGLVMPIVLAFSLARWRRMRRDLQVERSLATAEERQRISRDLHDTLAQDLAYLHLKLDQLSCADLQTIAVRQELEQMREVSNEAYERIYALLTELRQAGNPVLAEVLFTRAKWVGARAGFDVVLRTEGEPLTLQRAPADQIFCVFREALSNIEKHAGARHVEINMVWRPGRLTVALHDDGRGFDAGHDARPGHFGLSIMQGRAADVGGRLMVTSSPGQGTTVRMDVPLVKIQATGEVTPPARDALPVGSGVRVSHG